MNSLKTTAAALLLASSLSANAGLITDVESVNEYVGWFDNAKWTHDLNDNGFVLGSAQSATLSIEFWDDRGRFDLGELATIIVGVLDFQDGAWIYNPVNDWSQTLGINSLASLNNNGLLNVKVWSDFGDFYIGNSTLEVTTVDAPSVPEPSTLGLIGFGLGALMLARRKQTA
jgi:hypothetical protein